MFGIFGLRWFGEFWIRFGIVLGRGSLSGSLRWLKLRKFLWNLLGFMEGIWWIGLFESVLFIG